ncbi:hypothetical protein [Sulfobacillus harzensis]|uniref:Uncharacterized protein n=1 Tax=Sulfobacillus harzensis TaxID=2729629 RepID=A0A7Y0Q4D8_9FIRM|nr:hypothetical protein [Sulfobacillus harzensis]NMP24320.1 hypothetical protein [Sulfobacillus harzensis]
MTTWLLLGSGWWLAHLPTFRPAPARLEAHVRIRPRLNVNFPTRVHSTPEASTIGAHVLRSLLEGQTVSGVMVRDSDSAVILRNFYGPRRWSVYPLSPEAVTYKGGWRFMDHHEYTNAPVNLVIQNHAVVGVLGYHDAYGRVLRSRPGWVAIQTVNLKKHPNPACAPRVGKPILAHIVPRTVWNSKRGHLPKGSLVQYTIYGAPGFPVILGGIEDYGPAACAVHV